MLGVALCVLLYFATIKLLQRWVQWRGKPFDLNWVSQMERVAQAPHVLRVLALPLALCCLGLASRLIGVTAPLRCAVAVLF